VQCKRLNKLRWLITYQVSDVDDFEVDKDKRAP